MALSKADKQRWDEIDGLIFGAKDELKAAPDHTTLRQWAEDNGMDNGPDFGKFKSSLRKIGVDYNSLREETIKERDAALLEQAQEMEMNAEGLPFIQLECAAVEQDDEASFAITDAEGTALWFGRFSSKFERIRKEGDLVSAEQSAADKAVYAAATARKALGIDNIALWLTTSCPDLDEDSLRVAGARQGVALSITVDQDADKALFMAQMGGFRNLRDVPETELAALVETESDEEA